MKVLLQDVRYSLRQLVKSPGFSITAILSLACGIAATSAVFSVIWAVLMNPYPYANADRMVHINLRGARPGGEQGFGTTASQWQQFRKNPAIEDAIITDDWSLTVTGQDIPEDVSGCFMSSNGFDFFGVAPALGRNFEPSDAIDGQEPSPVVVLSYKFWQRHYNSDPSIIGKTIEMVRKPYTVIGVAAPRFTWNDSDVYVPLKITQETAHAYDLEARLKPGVSHAIAEQQLQGMVTQFAKDSPTHYPLKPGPVLVQGLNDMFLEQIGGTLAMLFGAVLLLLAIGCGNVSILLLARGTAREHEFALRAAIGASRWRIMRQLLTESLILSLTGAALGVLLAIKLLAVIVALLPDGAFPHEAVIAINLPVLVFSVVVAIATGIVFGMMPALRLSRPDVREAMQAGSRKVAGSVSGKATSNALIGAQIALTLLMMAVAGDAVQGFMKLLQRPLGYNPHNVMSVGIPVHENTHKTIAERTAFFEALLEKTEQTPGVQMATISTNATPPSNGSKLEFEIMGQPSAAGQPIWVNWVGEGYFPVLQIALSQGRFWTRTETHNAAKVAVINRTMADKYFPHGDALGHFIRVSAQKAEPPFFLTADGADSWLQIVGVMADKLNNGLRKPVTSEIFIPYTLAEPMHTQILVRAAGSPLPMIHSIGQQVQTVDADQQISGRIFDLDHWIQREPEYAQGQLVSWLFGAFAALALLLAAVGLYSVVSYTVAQRTNEFGIRMALGALHADVLGLVFRSMTVSVGGGVAVGVLLALSLHKLLAHLSSDTEQGYLALLLAIVVLTTVALVASGIPARRAVKIEPMEALRYE
ncbi:putative permease [Granulicella aggregans]|uniref:Putative permease n=1 Tax=Granulicella aggregans TaxID=474949 RepID=A0A7W7Z9H0_9BACT|nr:ABC transporter permease [Granulicella aggregans]MBB5055710.1 putative permease [Granulicella aggregans]